MQPVAVDDLKYLVIGRQIVRVQKGLARDRHQCRIEDVHADPIGAVVAFASMIRPQHTFENRLELGLGVLASDLFASTRRHGPHAERCQEADGGLHDVTSGSCSLEQASCQGSGVPAVRAGHCGHMGDGSFRSFRRHR
jgi:hypothetical protein